MLHRRTKIILIWLLIIALGVWYFKFVKHYPRHIDLQAKDDFWGVTYSPEFATYLGLDWRETYEAILDDLQVKNIRLPIYWEMIEAEEGVYDFSDYDYILGEGEKRGVNFIANIGWRLPRWPECHAPAWLAQADEKIIKAKTLPMLKMVVERYKNRPAIVAWQVENEPLLDWFGQCPRGDKDFLQTEVDFVRSLDDSRPIIISASGELSTWRTEAKTADIFATTMYRVVWNRYFGYFRYPFPAWLYVAKAKLVGLKPDEAIISELQTEPWVPSGRLVDLAATEFDKSFNLEQFKANLQFAIDVDFKQAYLWGVEWWYLEKQRGNSAYWDLARTLFRN
jgi:hypothetical protein